VFSDGGPVHDPGEPGARRRCEEGVFILYEYELQTGERHRNAEFITVRDGRLVETQVFFGGHVRD